jgi:hypothetical protein
VLGPDGLSRFEELRRRTAAHAAILYAFDLIEHDGKDLRNLPFLDRKAALARLLRNARQASCLTNTLPTKSDVSRDGILFKPCSFSDEALPSRADIRHHNHLRTRACTHKIASGENRLVSIGPLQNSLFRGNVRLQLSISRPTQ